MNIYQIDQAIMSLVDPETGEIADFEQFEQLNMDREAKVENLACWIKNLTADAKAIREEEKVLAERRKAAEKKADDLTRYLEGILAGEKFSSPKCKITYRKSAATEVDEEAFIEWAKANNTDFLTWAEPKPNKTAIKEAIIKGEEIPYARIVNNVSMNIK